MSQPGTGGHAIVIGASMAGLAIAKALTAGFDRVTVLERDRVPDGIAHRSGVPQGRHLHGLLPAGASALEELFPGLLGDMVAGGASTGDFGERAQAFLNGHRLARGRVGREVVFASRPFIEAHVRDRIREDPAIRIRQRCEVRGVAASSDRRRVVGVKAAPRDGGAVETLAADLVVDCSGRRSPMPRWLERLGYDEPEVDELRIDLHYATRSYRLPPGVLDGELAVVMGPLPDQPRGGGMMQVEGGRWMVTLGGWGGEKPPLDPDGFEEYAARLPVSDLHDVLRHAEPLDDPVGFRYPASVRHRYERAARLPRGRPGRRGRGRQLQPDLRPGHDGRGAGGRHPASAARRGRGAVGADVVPVHRPCRGRSLGPGRRR